MASRMLRILSIRHFYFCYLRRMAHSKSDIISWIKTAVGNENCSVEVEEKQGKGNGYVGDIYFVKVNFNNGKELSLIAKISKLSSGNERIMADICKREVAFYSQVFPIFEQFQAEKDIREPFNSVPKCYKAFLTEHTEVIVQENMITRGYELHERSVPLNLNHMKLCLKNYAKFHGISFALRDQRKEVFKKIEEICFNHMVEKIGMFESMYAKGETKVIKNLQEAGRQDLAEKYEKLVEGGSAKRVKAIFTEEHEHRVVTHADCHNGNFLFEYKNGNKDNPSNMVLIDFQLSNMLPPMVDLGLYFYCGASKEEFAQFPELMEFYYKELSSFLLELGSDINKLYPISSMWDEWKKYSFYGFIISTFFLELLFIDKEDAPEGITDTNENFLDFNLKNRRDYLERLTTIVEHYFDFLAL